MTREASGGDIKYVQEATYADETKIIEVVGKYIKRSKSYNIPFKIGFITSHKEIK